MILFEPPRVNRRRLPLVGLIVAIFVCGLFILFMPDEDRSMVPIGSTLIEPSVAFAPAANPSVRPSLTTAPKENVDALLLQSIPTAFRPSKSEGLNRLEFIRRGIRDWSSADPIAAAESVLALQGDREEVLEQVALGWSKIDLNAAGEWARGLSPGRGRDRAIIAVGYEHARIDPIAAIRLVADLNPTTERDALVTHGVAQWAVADPKAASAWAQGLEETRLREASLIAIVQTWAAHEPANAADFTASNIPPGNTQIRAAALVAEAWAQSNPQSAAAWVEGFSEEAGRSSAVEGLLTAWITSDFDAAATWTQSLKNSALRDVAYAHLSRLIAPRDIELARVFARRVSNTHIRTRSMVLLGSKN